MNKDKFCGCCCWFMFEDIEGNGGCAKIFAEFCNCSDECHGNHFVSREDAMKHIGELQSLKRRLNDNTDIQPSNKDVVAAIDFVCDYHKTFSNL